MTYLTMDMAAMIISAAITALIGLYAYVNKRERGARYLAWVMLFNTLNACGSILERLSHTLTEKLHLFNFHQSAHIFAIPYFLFFVLEYVGQEQLLKPSKTFPILLYFTLWVSLLWTDSYHHLLRYDITLQDGVLTFSRLWGLYTAVINGIMGLCMFLAIFKYTKLGGVVSVGAEEKGEKVVVTVRDNEIGIGPERMSLLFGGVPLGSFPGTAGEHGTGIGLLVCKELVQRSGGEIGVNSAPGEGSVFYFSLPQVIT